MQVGDWVYLKDNTDVDAGKAYEVLRIGHVFKVPVAWLKNHPAATFVECDKLIVAKRDWEPSFHGATTDAV